MSWRFQLLNKPYGSVTEGPVWDGENLLFTHIAASCIYRCDHKTDEITVWREGTNLTNGLAHDEQGRLFGCCSGGRAILRFDPDGNNVVVAGQQQVTAALARQGAAGAQLRRHTTRAARRRHVAGARGAGPPQGHQRPQLTRILVDQAKR